MNFTELNLKPAISKALEANNLVTATPIQATIIPEILKGNDLIGQSHTGSGKTLAFLLPSLEILDPNLKAPQFLIVCPTRELANQVLTEVRNYSKFMEGVTSTLLCGGSQIRNQIFALKRANIVVGTPGRIVDHLQRKTLKLKYLKTIILDEADEILKMGFKTEIDAIFDNITNEHQTLLFSATLPKGVQAIANDYQKDAEIIKIEANNEFKNNIEQIYVSVHQHDKEQAFLALVKKFDPQLGIVFCNTKDFTERLSDLLRMHGFKTGVLNGDKRQGERNRVMNSFKQGRINLLIATDVAARGIDVSGVDYIFNYDLPLNPEIYTHRIGRTARAGAKGSAISLITNRDHFQQMQEIEKTQDKKLELLQMEEFAYNDLTRFARNTSGGSSRGGRNGSRGGSFRRNSFGGEGRYSSERREDHGPRNGFRSEGRSHSEHNSERRWNRRPAGDGERSFGGENSANRGGFNNDRGERREFRPERREDRGFNTNDRGERREFKTNDFGGFKNDRGSDKKRSFGNDRGGRFADKKGRSDNNGGRSNFGKSKSFGEAKFEHSFDKKRAPRKSKFN